MMSNWAKRLVEQQEALGRAIHGRRRFRACVRLVLQNSSWLGSDEDSISTNVAVNIKRITKKKIKSEFSLEEKSFMRVALEKRTDAEKIRLRKVLANLKCFRNYPSDVKQDLATIAYYSYLQPERCIVRENDEPNALYFVASGSARVEVAVFDELENKMISHVIEIKEAGDMFGEFALLIPGSKRTATIITNEPTELIYILRVDFERVLKSTVEKTWTDIKEAMSKFDYFEKWTVNDIQTCCMVSKMLHIEQDELVLSYDYGEQKLVHFLVEGHIDVIQSLELHVTSYKNKKTYRIYSNNSSQSLHRTITSEHHLRDQTIERKSILNKKSSTTIDRNLMNRISKNVFGQNDSSKNASESSFENNIRRLNPAQRVQHVKQCASLYGRATCAKETPQNVIETHFLNVATIKAVGTFNIGESLNKRYYVATSPATLLMIPKYWLLCRNRVTWHNIFLLMKKTLPSEDDLFMNFCKQKRWTEFRKDLYYRIADRSSKMNENHINNVPLCTRLKEDIDFYIPSRPFVRKLQFEDVTNKS